MNIIIVHSKTANEREKLWGENSTKQQTKTIQASSRPLIKHHEISCVRVFLCRFGQIWWVLLLNTKEMWRKRLLSCDCEACSPRASSCLKPLCFFSGQMLFDRESFSWPFSELCPLHVSLAQIHVLYSRENTKGEGDGEEKKTPTMSILVHCIAKWWTYLVCFCFCISIY